MARRNNKDAYITDQFIAQNLIEIEKPTTNIRTIIFMVVVIFLVIGGVGLGIYFNRDKINWEIRLPWQDEDDPPLFEFGNKSKGKGKNNSKQEIVIPEIFPSSTNFRGLGMNPKDLKRDNKGYTFTLELTPAEVVRNIRIEKAIVDGYVIDLGIDVGEITEVTRTIEVRINQTDLDRYNILSFSRLGIFVSLDKNDSHGDNTHIQGYFNFKMHNNITYDNDVKGTIEIYRYKNDGDDNILYYYKTEADKDNTYIYFYFENSDFTIKRFSIKKLLINGELFDGAELNAEVFRGARDIFYITIPKKKVKEVENFSVSLFITEQNDENEKNNAIYVTPEYTR